MTCLRQSAVDGNRLFSLKIKPLLRNCNCHVMIFAEDLNFSAQITISTPGLLIGYEVFSTSNKYQILN